VFVLEAGVRRPFIAVYTEESLLGDALVAAISSSAVQAMLVHDISAASGTDVDSLFVVPGNDPRSLGAELAAIRARHPEKVIIALSPDEQRLVWLAAAVGSPIETSVDLLEAISLARRVAAKANGLAEGLTPRHLDILRGVSKGFGPNDVADQLGITMKTLNNHLGAVYRRLGVDNLTHAVLRAYRLGLIDLN
jgi:DNA-binding NarL/FixJ family response regulator